MSDTKATAKSNLDSSNDAPAIEPCAIQSVEQLLGKSQEALAVDNLDGTILDPNALTDEQKGAAVKTEADDAIKGEDYKQIEAKSDSEDGVEPSEDALVSVEDVIDVSKVEPASGDEENISEEVAQKVAKIEPAAGDQAQGGISSGNGYGFQSSFDAQGVIGIEDVGPIAPTALQYGIDYNRDEYFLEEQQPSTPLSPLNPVLKIGDHKVYEDGSVKVLGFAAPESANGDLTIVISGIPAGWTVSDDAFDAADVLIGTGVFDSAAGTWTFTTTGGATFDGGPVFTPPADSDIDALNLVFNVSEVDVATGQSGSAVADFDIVVDAVADNPDIDAQDDSGAEGATLDIDVSALTGEEVNNGAGLDDGSESITGYEISGVPSGFTLSAGVETFAGSGVYVLTPAEIVGLQITPTDPNFSGSINLTATVFTTENPVTDGEFDLTNNNNQDNDVFTLTWNPVADKPKLTVDDAKVKEDSSVFVPVEAELTDTDGSEFLTITVEGVPASWGFSGGGWTQTGATTYEITVPAGDNYNGGFTLTPPADSDVDLTGINVTATSTEIANNDTASISESIDVIVDAVFDEPAVDGLDNAGKENTPLDVDITGAAGDTDGSETVVKYEVSDVPAGFTFNQGTDLGGGVWEFTPAELAGLQITPPTDYVGDIDLTVTIFTTENPGDTEFDTSDNTATKTDIFNLAWKPEANPPSVKVNNGVDDAQVKEDGSVDVPIVAALDPAGSGNEILTVTVTGIDPSWGFSAPVGDYDADAGTWTITLPAGEDLSTMFTFTPPADSDFDMTGLQATASAYEPSTDTTANATPDDFQIITDAVADKPEIDADGDVGNEGATLDIDVSALTGEEVNNGAGLDDGSESITGYEISGVPSGFTLSAGVETFAGSGVYVLTPAEIVGLQITPTDPTYNGSLDLTVTVFTTENPVSDGEFDLTDNNNQASDVITLTWKPVINPPCIEVNNGVDDAIVKEDGSIDVPITAQLGANPAAGEFLTVTVTGIDPAWGGFTATEGVYTPATGTWTVTLPAGAALDAMFTFTPNPDEDIDLSGMVATVVVTDPATSQTANDSDMFNVITDAVADVPNLDAGNANGEEGTTIPLTITTSVNDVDGSEVIEVVKIGNLPAGTSLTAGAYNAVDDVWELSPADLIGLGLVVPDGVTGNFTLNVESVAYEQNTNGNEVDLTDNRASAFDVIEICIEKDDVPDVKDDKVVVDETNLAPSTSANGNIAADFGNDDPGEINGNGTYSIGDLKSGGVSVDVVFDAPSNTYTGTAGGAPIFTLVVQNNGDYTFTLQGVIDHPDASNHNDFLPLQFGVTATDSDDDSADATITVRVYDDGPDAKDDYVEAYADDGAVIGNVVDNDDLSQDDLNLVTQIKFGSNVLDVPADGSDVSIDGQFGTLTINNSGDYTYDLFGDAFGSAGGVGGGGGTSFDPVQADANGQQNTISKNGITVSVANAGNFDITWLNTSDGNGLGIDNLSNGDSIKVWPQGETFDIDFDKAADTVALTIAEIGSNNNFGKHGVDFVIRFADGSSIVGEQQFVPSEISGGVFSFTLNAADYGGQLISGVDLYSKDVGAYKGASFLLNNVAITYPGDESPECVADEFEYVLTDYDLDNDAAVLKIKTFAPTSELIVGKNVDDIDGSHVSHLVNGDEGVIDGGRGTDILVGDAGGSFLEPQTQDYNFVFMLDVSGSMGDPNSSTSKVSLLFDAVQNLLTDADAYNGGDVMVHIVPFSDHALTAGTFNLSDTDGLSDLVAYLDGIDTGGYTNYESPMQEAISWLQGPEALGGNAITTTYFISDGEPNRYINNSGDVSSGNAATVMGQVTGTDGTNEVQILQNLSDDLIAVGIDIGGTISNLNVIDSDGSALNINNPTDLTVALADTSPLDKLLSVGGDDIRGGDGDDLIFGDVLFTDDVATLHGLTTDNGAGWEVFERLENGESALNPAWTRDDTIDYIRANAEELSQESVNSNGVARNSGDDVINGGAGNDLIFGQEGDDIISGGAGNDVIYGGSGSDQFLFGAITDGRDDIMDFDAGEGDQLDLSSLLFGYDSLTDDIADFVISTEVGGDTVISVDTTGNGGASEAYDLAVLHGVTGFDADVSVKTDGVV
ncbi:MAG: type I secretion C-terminal target domain-containing protein [Alphaproteobacteria bacterium]